MPLLADFFIGLGWPWVGELIGFIIIFVCFPTQQNLVNRKHRTVVGRTRELSQGSVLFLLTVGLFLNPRLTLH